MPSDVRKAFGLPATPPLDFLGYAQFIGAQPRIHSKPLRAPGAVFGRKTGAYMPNVGVPCTMNRVPRTLNGVSRALNGLSRALNEGLRVLNGLSRRLNGVSSTLNGVSRGSNNVSGAMNCLPRASRERSKCGVRRLVAAFLGRLVAATFKSDRGDESPLTTALTSQRTPH